MPTKPPAQPQRTQSAEEFYKVWIAQHPKLLGKSVTWPVDVCLFEFAEAYAQSLKQAAAPAEPVADPSKEELVMRDAREDLRPIRHGRMGAARRLAADN